MPPPSASTTKSGPGWRQSSGGPDGGPRRWNARGAAATQAGLPAVTVKLPCGPRLTTAAGRPLQACRRDQLSSPYRRRRGAAAARARTREDRARRIAAEVVATHGASLVAEEGDMRLWARRWQRGMLAFTPGRMVAAIGAEAVAALSSGTGPLKASTRPTAMSQPCPCGTRVPKTLAERTHRCPSCGLVGDRGLVAAALAAFVTFGDPLDPGTARVDYQAARLALAQIPGLQAALAESSAAPLARHRPLRDGGHGPAGAGRLGEVPGRHRRPCRMSSQRLSPEGTKPGHRWCLPDLTSVLSTDRTHGQVLSRGLGSPSRAAHAGPPMCRQPLGADGTDGSGHPAHPALADHGALAIAKA